jgi:hypothetical protein
MRRIVTSLACALIISTLRAQQTQVDRDIDPVIAQIIASTLAVDNHAHPMLPPSVDPTDRNFDALPVDNMAPETDPVAWRADYAPLHDAWKALYNIDLQPPLTAETQKQLEAARTVVRSREGERYPTWVLDRSGIDIMLANRVSMGTGVHPPRFRWVPYLDALLFPLNNAGLSASSPDRAQFFALEDKLRTHYYADLKIKTSPATLDAYIQQIVLPTLHKQHDGGAVAVKFELAYLRSLDIGGPTHAQAAAAYAKYIRGGTPNATAYKALQDYLFRSIAVECGKLHMAVHFHAMAGGGSYFSVAGVSPLNLEPLFNDPRMRDTNFVLLHGGFPFVHEIGAELQKPNVYLDLSQQALLVPARTLSTWLREWLELYPDKVLFATDGYPFSASLGWEEATWLAARNVRQALGLALTGMERDGEISSARAGELARTVLRGNAETLYGFGSK